VSVVRTIQNGTMPRARLAVLLRRYLNSLHASTPHSAFIARCVEELESGKRWFVPKDVFRAALMEITDCAVVGCRGKALYRVGITGLCRAHKGLAVGPIQQKSNAVQSGMAAKAEAERVGDKEWRRDLSGAKSLRCGKPTGKPQRLRQSPGVDILGLAAMLTRRRRNLGRRAR
jgi:hypothetical protein